MVELKHGTWLVFCLEKSNHEAGGRKDVFLQVPSTSPPLDSVQACMNHLMVIKIQAPNLITAFLWGRILRDWWHMAKAVDLPSKKIVREVVNFLISSIKGWSTLVTLSRKKPIEVWMSQNIDAIPEVMRLLGKTLSWYLLLDFCTTVST